MRASSADYPTPSRRECPFDLGGEQACAVYVLHVRWLRRNESAAANSEYDAVLREVVDGVVGHLQPYLVHLYKKRNDCCVFSTHDNIAQHRIHLATCEQEYMRVHADCRREEQNYEFWNACCAGVLMYADPRRCCLIGLPHRVLQSLAKRRRLACSGTTHCLLKQLADDPAHAADSPRNDLAATLRSLKMRELQKLLLQCGRSLEPTKAAAVASLRTQYRLQKDALIDPDVSVLVREFL